MYLLSSYKLSSSFRFRSLPSDAGLKTYDYQVNKVFKKGQASIGGFEISETIDAWHYKAIGIANFSFHHNNEILIEQYSKDEALVEIIFIERVFPLFLSSRGEAVFKGMAVMKEKKAHVYFGVPGVGLSSIAAHFYQKGYKIIADSWFQLLLKDNQYFVIPMNVYTKLSIDTIEYLDLYEKVKYATRPNMNRYYLNLTDGYQNKLFPIVSLNQLLILGNGKMSLKHEKMNSFKKMESLSRFIYPFPEEKVNKSSDYFNLISGLSTINNCNVFSRPIAMYDIKEHVNFIIASLDE